MHIKLLLNYINWNPTSKLEIFRNFYLYFYSFTFAISFILGWQIIKSIYENDNIEIKYVDLLFQYTFFGTLLGARIGQIIFYDFSYFSDHLIEAFLPIRESKDNFLFGIIKGYKYIGYKGLSSHGATIGILITNFLYSRKIKKSFLWVCDRFCLIASLSASLIRIGNFFNSEMVGTPCKFSWGVKFLQMDTNYGPIVPRHPTQIYESICYFFVFILLLFLYKQKIHLKKIGFISGVFLFLIWICRFLIEFFKEPQGDELIHFLKLNTGHLLSIPFIIMGIFFILFYRKNLNK